ncbi:Gfo/Idh/MocA family protein [Marinimicrobium sp. ARAG 43.8]|uniref:Gfo/Idh/MocA family protein n=1 Tax=Marinimicrobium sp. ARAG 43.8 TaxID=3418719 RepID=UPI003CF067A3
MRKIRWGVLSTANIGRKKVLPAIQASERGELVAVASRSADNARAFADELGIAKSYGSYEQLLADPDIDAIYNPLPNHLHVPMSVKALEAGKHVLCEKPISLDTDDLQALKRAAKANPTLKVMEAFMYRFHPQWAMIQQWLEQGVLGQIRHYAAFFSYNNRDEDNIRNLPEIGGGGLMDIGCYGISSARFVYGAEPVRVIGSVQPLAGYNVDCLTSAIMEFPDGTASFTVTTKTEHTQWAELHGEKGLVRLERPFNPELGWENRVTRIINGKVETFTFPEHEQYQLMVDAFAQSIQDGTPSPTPLWDAEANMRVIDALFNSQEEGRWVTLD